MSPRARPFQSGWVKSPEHAQSLHEARERRKSALPHAFDMRLSATSRVDIVNTLRTAKQVVLLIRGRPAAVYARVVDYAGGTSVVVRPWGLERLLRVPVVHVESVAVVARMKWERFRAIAETQRASLA